VFKLIKEMVQAFKRANRACTLAEAGDYEQAKNVMINKNLEGWL
jgi:hypothetical protein